MNIALHNPMFSGASGLHGWILEFIKAYKPAFYISDMRYLPRFFYFMHHHHLNPLHFKLLFSVKELNSYADVLVCFNGHPYRQDSKPIKDFSGLKIYHLMDYTNFPTESNQSLQDTGVNFVFGYARHDLYCPFFQKKYPRYKGKVIPIPFGFAERFQMNVPFEQRKDKVIALGAVNSFSDPVHTVPDFQELNDFYLARSEKFMHKFRRMLVEQEQNFLDFMDSKLPHYPQTKDFGYDLVQKFNEYKMFVSCESLLYFPAGKTFEGPSAGAVMICSTHPCFSDYGFEDGINCVKHKEFDLEDFKEKAVYYLENEGKLEEIQKRGTEFMREQYSHPKVAERVFAMVEEKYEKKSVII
ncbi:MAG: hypothetical protein A3E07_00340 [Candidatus Wildermuthbacteria bacterium RIFCSPHIGHO2_12_FULL_45_9]|nr:MAG: hypothetical protein A3E07_00340 [Candidatus Wildermuthbacteria bacterium RIFCSPHIGHO2_12_FULL_45_9]